MFSTKKITTVFLLLLGSWLYSQNNFEGLGETGISINHRVNSNYKFNLTVQSRYYVYQDDNFSFNNRQLDFVHFSTLNLNYNNSISLGVQYRLREAIDGASNELRLTQQFNFTKRHHGLRFGHRVRLEQRILEDLTILRTRYRFTLDFPLNGEKLNIGERYLVTSTELLLSLSNAIKPKIDHRITGQIGWLLSEKSKIQVGFQNRFEAFNIKTENKLYFLTSYILNV